MCIVFEKDKCHPLVLCRMVLHIRAAPTHRHLKKEMRIMRCGQKKRRAKKKPEHGLKNFTDFAAPSWTMKQHSSHQRWNWCLPSFSKKIKLEEREIDSGVSMHMSNQKFDIRRIGHRVSRLSTTVFTANGSSDTREKATVFVKGWDKIVTVQLLEDTRAFLSL